MTILMVTAIAVLLSIACLVLFSRSVLAEINKYTDATRPRDEELAALKERVSKLEAKCHHCGH